RGCVVNSITPRCVLVTYHPAVPRADEVATALVDLAASRGVSVTAEALPAGDGLFLHDSGGADLLVCVGGDGTVLHAAAFAAEHSLPIFGVRMGRLGFLTETVEARALADFARVLDGEGRLEHRCLIQAQLGDGEQLHALNDVVI